MPDRCPACGHRGPSDARFCSRCGLPHLFRRTVDSTDVMHRMPPVERGRGLNRPLIMAMMLALGVLGWRFLVADPNVPSSAASEPAGPIGESKDPAAAPKPSTVVGAATAVRPPAVVDLIELAVEKVPEQPELAALAGHHVVVSHAGGLIRLDTDTGQVDRYDRTRIAGSLLGHYRDQLIFVEAQRRVIAVTAEDPTGDPVELIDLQWPEWPLGIQGARMIDDHRLSLVVRSFLQRDGRAVDRLLLDLESRRALNQSSGSWQASDLTWVPGGGLFEFADGSYRHLADGAPVVAGRRYVLVHECQGYDDCARHWIDRRTGEHVDRPIPPGAHGHLEFLDPDDRLLFVNGEDGHRYFDATNGWFLPSNVIRGTAGGYLDGPVEAVVGGRLLLAAIIGGLVVYDLDTHVAHMLDFGADDVRGVTAIVAVPKPNPWAAEQ